MNSGSEKPDSQSPPTKISMGWLAFAAIPLLLRILLGFVESNWWGLNALAFTDVYYTLGTTTIALVTIALILIALRRASNAVLTLSLSIGFGALVFLFGRGSHLFGDGYALIGALAQSDQLYAHKFAYLATTAISAFYQLFNGASDRALNDSALAINVFSAICGAISFWTWLKISSKLANNKVEERIFIVTTMLTGSSLLFFGNGEFYPLALAFISFIILSFVSLIKAETASTRYRLAGALAVLSVIAPFYLAQLIFILPATILMIGLGFTSNPKRERLWWIISFVSLIGIIAAMYWQSQTDLWIQARTIGLAGKPPEFDYSLFSIRRLFDVLNTSFVLWPLFPLTLWLCIRYVWQERCNHIVGGLAMLSLSFTVWILISDFPGGAAREITTIAIFALPASILASYLWLKRFGDKTWFKHTTVGLGVVAALTFSALSPVYVDGDAGVKYLDHDYQSRKDRYLSGLVDFRDHYFFLRDFPAADKWEWSFTRKSPSFLDHRSIRLMYNKGQFSETLDRLALLMTTNPHWAGLYSTKAATLQALGRNSDALQTLDRGLQLSPGDVGMLTVRGNILGTLKQPINAEKMYRQALKYDSRNTVARKEYGFFLIKARRSLDVERQAYFIFEDDPRSPYPFLLVGLAAFERGQHDRSRKYLNIAIERGDGVIPEIEIARLVLGKIEEASKN